LKRYNDGSPWTTLGINTFISWEHMGYDARTTWGTKKNNETKLNSSHLAVRIRHPHMPFFSSWSALRAGRTSEQKGVDTEANARKG
jgi:hypothetical protein